MAKKTYVIDTSVLLSDFNCINKFGNNDIIIPLKVLEEVDNHKKRQDSVGANARSFIRLMDGLREKGSLHKGVRMAKGKGVLQVISHEGITENLPPDLTRGIPDHMIIETALTVDMHTPKTRKVVLVSRDVNMRVISEAVGVHSEDYSDSQVVETTDQLYSGMVSLLVDDELIDQFYDGEEIYIPLELAKSQKARLYPHMFIMLVSSTCEKKTALCKFNDYNTALRKVVDYKADLQWGIFPRNKEQSFAFNLLMDPDVHLVTLIGQAGSGKTLCAIAAGMEQAVTFDMPPKRKNKTFTAYNEEHEKPTSMLLNSPYRKLVVSRPVQPMGRDIGFLPGTMEDKMLPWLKPIQDNMQLIMGNDKIFLQEMMDSGTIELEALTYIRGRSISNAYIIVDEAQNLTAHEVKTIITRAGEGTKIVLTGDIEQIDNIYTNETSNGLTYAIEKFKESPIAGHVSFKKGERSKLATAAAKLL